MGAVVVEDSAGTVDDFLVALDLRRERKKRARQRELRARCDALTDRVAVGDRPIVFFETSLIAFSCEARFPCAQRDTPNM